MNKIEKNKNHILNIIIMDSERSPYMTYGGGEKNDASWVYVLLIIVLIFILARRWQDPGCGGKVVRGHRRV
jgi:hypothetical protein